MIHRINVFLLSIILIFAQTFSIVNASTNVGGWDVNIIRQGITTLYDATKQVLVNGSTALKRASVAITPTASQVAKNILKVGGGAAFVYAVTALIGDGVDWVLDPANNAVRYTKRGHNGGVLIGNQAFPNTGSEQNNIINAATTYYRDKGINAFSSGVVGNCDGGVLISAYGIFGQTLKTECFPVVPPVPSEIKFLPLPTVGQQILNDAQAEANSDRKSAAQNFVNATADTAIASPDAFPDENSRPVPYVVPKFEATATVVPDADAIVKPVAVPADPAVPLDPNAPPVPPKDGFKLPAFCSWVPSVCMAANWILTQPQVWADSVSGAWTTGKEWVTSVKDWVKTEEPPQRETKVDVEVTPSLPTNTNYLSWQAYCPFSQKSDDISLNGESTSISSDLSSWCTMASQIKPFVLMAGALASLMIVSGVAIRGDD